MVENNESREIAATPRPHSDAPPLLGKGPRPPKPPRAPRTPRSQRTNGSTRIAVWIIVGAVALGIAALIAATFFIIDRVAEISAPAVQLQEITTLPRDDAWTLEHPLADSGDGVPYLAGFGVDQDRALVLFSAIDADGDRSPQTQLSLLDTATGEVLWAIDWEASIFAVESVPANQPYVVSSNAAPGGLVTSLDPDTGAVLSDSSDLGPTTVVPGVSSSTGVSPLGADLLIEFDDQIARVSPSALDQPLWAIDLDGHEAHLAGRLLMLNGEAYDLDSGDEVRWRADRDVQFLANNSAVIGTLTDESAAMTSLASYAENGDDEWSVELPPSSTVFFMGQREIVLTDPESTELFAINLADGAERWRIELEVSSAVAASGSDYVGVLLVPVAGEKLVMIDLDTGEELFEHRYVAADGQPRVLGMTRTLFYLAGAEEGEFSALDTHTGEQLWTMRSAGTSFVVAWGGRLVAVALASDEPQNALSGIAP